MRDTPSPESLKAAEKLLATFDVGTRWTNINDTERGWRQAPVETVAFAIDAAFAGLRERCESYRYTLGLIKCQCVEETQEYKAFAEFTKEEIAKVLSPTPKEPTHG